MDSFALYDIAIKNFEENASKDDVADGKKSPSAKENVSTACPHKSIEVRSGISTCTTCGEITMKAILHDREWRNYSDQRRDPARVQKRKVEERSIFRDVEGLGFSDKVVTRANELYQEVSKGSIFRGNCRKAIIFAVIFYAYKSFGQPQTHEKLIKLFKLDRKTGLKGLKHVTLNSTSPLLRGGHITAKHLIRDTMSKFSATEDQILEVQRLHAAIKNRSSNLNRARPNSIACGLIYFWIDSCDVNISLREFASKTNLSEITISKIAKEIESVVEQLSP
jgi:transcription initiation factor TFIIIB Brf1 subunit/transcription initiation factor TFIIB